MAGKRAVILAGGKGMRLRPYTTVLPKPLMPLGDQPILEIILRQLAHHGFTRVTIATGHLASLIEAFCGDGREFGLSIDYHRESEPLGTVGGLALIEDLDTDFLVINGDVLTDMDHGRLFAEHEDNDAVATIATRLNDIEIQLGVLELGEEGDPSRVVGYREKPRIVYEASMGVYCFSPSVLDHIEAGAALDFPELMLRLIAAGEIVRARRSEDYWLDIGRHETYEQAMEEFERMRDRLLPAG